MNKFSYYSEQVHSIGVNGKQKTRRNIVNIKNNKGKKIIEEGNGKSVTRKQKNLSKKEIKHIRQNKFIPGLFRKL